MNNNKAIEATRAELIETVEEAFGQIANHIRMLELACVDAFDATGFTPGEAWEALPHKYVADSLTLLYPLIEATRAKLESDSAEGIVSSLRQLQQRTEQHFEQVEEFLNGRFSRMPKEEWLKHYPNFHRDMEAAALNDELSWTIGKFVRPSEWAVERRKELEAA